MPSSRFVVSVLLRGLELTEMVDTDPGKLRGPSTAGRL
jgi:hypothetical protein